jgi:hypothetical protein
VSRECSGLRTEHSEKTGIEDYADGAESLKGQAGAGFGIEIGIGIDVGIEIGFESDPDSDPDTDGD